MKPKKTQNTMVPRTTWKRYLGQYWQFYAMLLLPFFYFILFKYVPMFGNILAFRRFRPLTGPYGVSWVGLRYFNVFGRRQDPNGAYAAVIPKFIKQLLNGEVPTINGDGRQSRDFTYIENVIEANLKACLASEEACGQAYNIAYGGRDYLIDIYYGLTKALGLNVEPNFGPDRAGDIKHSNADISKARELLGYDPDWSFARGIEAAIAWYKANL